MSTYKSKKNKVNSTIDKVKLWNVFDNEIKPEKKEQAKLECLYQTIQDRESCERCNSSLGYSDEGFLTCMNNKCGIIYKDMIDQSPEWRYYGADDNHASDPTRCGMPINPLLEESSFGCKILSTGKQSYEMQKIRRYTEWHACPYKEKSLYEGFQQINIYAQNAGISKKIIDDAMMYHKKISEYEQTFRGNNKDGLTAASLYISCRANHFPRTAKELATIFYLDITSATNGCKRALSIIHILEKNMEMKDKTSFCKTKPEDFIERYCTNLRFTDELTKLCIFIAKKIETNNLMTENNPISISTGIIYFVSHFCGLNVSKKDIREISETSEVTINKCFKKLEKIKDTLIPPSILEKYA
jgi:transcription initiation factor TFIIB